MKKYIILIIAIVFFTNTGFAQWTQSGTNISTTNNVGIGTPSTSRLVIRDRQNIDGISISMGGGINSLGFNRNVEEGKIFNTSISAWQFTARNERFALEGFNGVPNQLISVLKNGNIGIGTNTPSQKLQIGRLGDNQQSKISIPGVYNFEEIKLGQFGNGRCGLEFINHTNANQSYGVRLYANVDDKISGLQIQTADPVSSAQDLVYSTRLAINTLGNVGIGTISPQAKLDVAGTIRAREVKVEVNAGADHVFNEEYNLKPLTEVENFIKENKHLPEIPSEKQMQQDGLNMNEFQIKLLQKIEELTLYTIQLEKRINELEKN